MDGTMDERSQVDGEQLETMPVSNTPAEAASGELPDGVAQRTAEEFEKLKAHNAELKIKLQAYEAAQASGSVLDTISPKTNVQSTPVQVSPSSLVDKEGYVDTVKLAAELEQAKRDAAEAKRKADEVVAQQESEETRKVYEVFPYLDPRKTDVFNKKFFDLVRNEMIGQAVEGKKKNFMEAALKAKELYDPGVSSESKKSQERLEQREQLAQPAKTAAKPAQNHEALVIGSMKGNTDAIAQRLANAGY